MTKAPGKARRRWLIAPYILAVLLAGGWSAYWFVARDRIEKGLDAQAARLRDQGYQVSWSARKIGGFPFRFFAELKDARIAESGGWSVLAPTLEAQAAAYAPTVVVLVAPQGVVLSRPDGRSFEVKGQALRASIGGYDEVPPRISVEGADLVIASRSGGTAMLPAIKRFELHVRPAADGRADVAVLADEATAAPDSLLGLAAEGRPVSIRLAGQASQAAALSGAGWSGLIRNWAAAGGVFDIREGGVRAGEAMATLRPSQVSADADGRLAGELSLALTGGADGALALGALGATPDETAAVAGGGPSLSATLTFEGGRTYLGPLPIGPAPRLY